MVCGTGWRSEDGRRCAEGEISRRRVSEDGKNCGNYLPETVSCDMVYNSCFPREAISLESLRVSAEGVRQEEKRTCCISQAKGQGGMNFLRELICLYQLFLFARMCVI